MEMIQSRMAAKREAAPKAGAPHVKVIAKNKRAFFDYHVEDKLECGVALRGTEVKSLREHSAQLSDAYAVGQHDELMLLNMQIPQYGPAGPLSNHEPKRTRKLLLHRREIDKLLEKQQKAGYALIPLSIYFKDGIAKIELGVCKGKAGADKRETIAARDAKREMDRARKR
jgi:SsrA-binding protein